MTGGYKDEKLIKIGKGVELIEAALSFASELVSDEFADDRYDVDFEKGSIKWSPDPQVHVTIEDLPAARTITLSSIKDIYNALTNPEILDQVLYQYLANMMPSRNLKHVRKYTVELSEPQGQVQA